MNKIPSFIIFFVFFIALYGSLHFYFYRKITNAFDMGIVSHTLIIVLLTFLLISPVIVNMAGNSERHTLNTAFSYTGYIWMAVLFLFFSIYILIDLYRLILYISSRFYLPELSTRLIPEPGITFMAVMVLVAGISTYGFFEAADIKVERIGLNTSKLPRQMDSFRVVQIGDTHFSLTNGTRLARKIGEAVKKFEPDMIVSTGDLTDRFTKDMDPVAVILRNLEAPYGKYACAGNHEFIHGIQGASEFATKAGFRMLRNEVVCRNGFLCIAGIDDPAGKRFDGSTGVREGEVLESFLPDRLNVLLKHQPRIGENSSGKFDIQLSGHTHGGQIFPFSVIVSLFYPYMEGLVEVNGGSYLYVSRGTGTWGPPIRVMAPPEITVIDFYRPEN